MNNLDFLLQSLNQKHVFNSERWVVFKLLDVTIFSYSYSTRKKDKYHLYINICRYVSKNGTANNTLKEHYNALLHSAFKHYYCPSSARHLEIKHDILKEHIMSTCTF